MKRKIAERIIATALSVTLALTSVTGVWADEILTTDAVIYEDGAEDITAGDDVPAVVYDTEETVEEDSPAVVYEESSSNVSDKDERKEFEEQTQTEEIDGMTISVEGDIPVGYSLSVEPLDKEDYEDLVMEKTEGKIIAIYDINISDNKGTEWEPADDNKTLTMTFEGLDNMYEGLLKLVHITDEGKVEQKTEVIDTLSEENEMACDVDNFSGYALVEATATTTLTEIADVNISSIVEGETNHTVYQMALTYDGVTQEAFCLDLGKAARSGHTYTQDGAYKNSKILKILTVYDSDDNKENGTPGVILNYVEAQALVWGAQKGKTSEDDMITILEDVEGSYQSDITNTASRRQAIINAIDSVTTTSAYYTWQDTDAPSTYQRFLTKVGKSITTNVTPPSPSVDGTEYVWVSDMWQIGDYAYCYGTIENLNSAYGNPTGTLVGVLHIIGSGDTWDADRNYFYIDGHGYNTPVGELQPYRCDWGRETITFDYQVYSSRTGKCSTSTAKDKCFYEYLKEIKFETTEITGIGSNFLSSYYGETIDISWDNITYIGDYAFARCSARFASEDITLTNMEYVGDEAFMIGTTGNGTLGSFNGTIDISGEDTVFGDSAFSFYASDHYYVDDLSIYNAKFRYNVKNGSAKSNNPIFLKSGAGQVGPRGTYGYSTHPIWDVIIGSDCEIIPNGIFWKSTLGSLTFENGCEEIQQKSFYATQFKQNTITFPASLEIIGASAFSTGGYAVMNGLETIDVEDGSNLRQIGANAFESYYPNHISSVAFDKMTALESIGAGAFINAVRLTDIYLSNTVESIGKEAFCANHPNINTVKTGPGRLCDEDVSDGLSVGYWFDYDEDSDGINDRLTTYLSENHKNTGSLEGISDVILNYAWDGIAHETYAHDSDGRYIPNQPFAVDFVVNRSEGLDPNYTAPERQWVIPGECATEPEEPKLTRSFNNSYKFDGWYIRKTDWETSNGGTKDELYDFSTPVTSNVTLYAHWSSRTIYTVRFDANGGNFTDGAGASSQRIGEGLFVEKPNDPTNGYYDFMGWFIDDDTEWDFDNDTVTDNITLKAHWSDTPPTCTVSFNTAGGTPATIEPQTVEKGGYVEAPDDPEKYHYIFEGWFNGDNAWYFRYNKVTEDMTLTAKWSEAPQYTVTFNTDGGTPDSIQSQTVFRGEYLEEPTDPVKEGYEFDGWYYDGDIRWNFNTRRVYSSVELVAHYKKIHTVTFVNSPYSGTGAPEIPPQYIVDGGKVEEPDVEWEHHNVYAYYKRLDDHSVLVWNFNNNTVTEDMTLEVNWNEDTYYYVSFNINGGSPTVPSQKVYENERAEEPIEEFEKENYTFDGWYLGDNKYDFSTPVTSYITLKAHWTPKNQYTVSFNSLGGTPTPPNQSIYEGEQVEEPDFDIVKPHYDFKGWLKDGSPYDFSSEVHSDFTLTANWESKPVYTVTFDVNGGDPAPAAQPVERDELVREPLPRPTKAHSEFEGWFNGSSEWDFASDTVTGDLVLTAHWEDKEQFNVTYNPNGGSFNPNGSETEPIVQTIDKNDTAENLEVYREHYEFSGWHKNGVNYIFNTPVTSSFELVAEWELKPQYEITFNAAGGSPTPGSQTIEKGLCVEEPTVEPEWENHNFAGWYKGDAISPYDFGEEVTSSFELTAHWTDINHYTVTFNSAGGSAVGSQTIEENEKAERPENPTKEHCDFGGWFLGNTEYDFNTPVTANIELTAHWTDKPKYTITFDTDGGEPVPDPQEIERDLYVVMPQTEPRKAHFEFLGWYNGNTEYDFGLEVTGPLTLKAKWGALPTVTVSFNAAGGTPAPVDQIVDVDGLITRPDEMVKDGYEFFGWWTAAGGEHGTGDEWDFAHDTVGRNMTLYAYWKKPATVAFDSNGGGTPPTPINCYVGDVIDLPDVERMSKAGYRYDGWGESSIATTRVSDPFTVPDGGAALYAIWKEHYDYTIQLPASVTLYDNGAGTISAPVYDNNFDIAVEVNSLPKDLSIALTLPELVNGDVPTAIMKTDNARYSAPLKMTSSDMETVGDVRLSPGSEINGKSLYSKIDKFTTGTSVYNIRLAMYPEHGGNYNTGEITVTATH